VDSIFYSWSLDCCHH